ncbi:MAG: hypothetical protein GTO03_16305 [Planctomycetales bacterium]|nr:hypothetical protein [Planctomycetales bacterium]
MSCRVLICPLVVALTALLPAGCQQSHPSPAEGKADGVQVPSPSDPPAVVTRYLEAVRTGDVATVNQLLTSRARQKTGELQVAVAPPGSPTARYEVGQIRYLTEAQDAAHVASRWTDLNDHGQPETFEVTWLMRREDAGWRVAGMMGRFIEGEPLMVFNFENPVEVLRRQGYLQEEVAQRGAAERQVQASNRDTSQQ